MGIHGSEEHIFCIYIPRWFFISITLEDNLPVSCLCIEIHSFFLDYLQVWNVYKETPIILHSIMYTHMHRYMHCCSDTSDRVGNFSDDSNNIRTTYYIQEKPLYSAPSLWFLCRVISSKETRLHLKLKTIHKILWCPSL